MSKVEAENSAVVAVLAEQTAPDYTPWVEVVAEELSVVGDCCTFRQPVQDYCKVSPDSKVPVLNIGMFEVRINLVE